MKLSHTATSLNIFIMVCIYSQGSFSACRWGRSAGFLAGFTWQIVEITNKLFTHFTTKYYLFVLLFFYLISPHHLLTILFFFYNYSQVLCELQSVQIHSSPCVYYKLFIVFFFSLIIHKKIKRKTYIRGIALTNYATAFFFLNWVYDNLLLKCTRPKL